jgi:hypothetical protein
MFWVKGYHMRQDRNICLWGVFFVSLQKEHEEAKAG